MEDQKEEFKDALRQEEYMHGGETDVSQKLIEAAMESAIKSKDPWMHRSCGMLCESCMWFVRKQANTTTLKLIGRCRRHAPTMNGYPVVFGNDWCGDHKLNEDKA